MLAVFDHRTPLAAEQALKAHGIATLRLPAHPYLPAPVAAHGDMVLYFGKEKILCTQAYARVAKEELECIALHCQRPICMVEEEVFPSYPTDILFNAAVVGEDLFCFSEHTAGAILREFLPDRIHTVRQGYAKCSVLPVGPRAFLTQDPTLAKAGRALGMNVLELAANEILLPGYDHGFWGGCASYAPYHALKELYFCGDIHRHPKGQEIQAFCNAHGRIPVALGAFPLTDVGTIFMI